MIIFIENFSTYNYFLIKFFHFFSLIAWMAGLFYLPRIFVYHAAASDEMVKITLDLMAKKLYVIIMRPAMCATLVFGGLLSILPHNRMAGWLHLKLHSILALIAFQFYMNYQRKRLSQRNCTISSNAFRYFNEIPTLLLIVILVCATFKPF